MSNFSQHAIHGDRWDGLENEEWRIENPSRADLEQALLRLDGRVFTMVIVAGLGEKHLSVGGGDGRYVVYATFDNLDFWNLLRPKALEEVVLVNCGGQEGEFPAKQVVSIDQAKAAGITFLELGELDPSQLWEKQ